MLIWIRSRNGFSVLVTNISIVATLKDFCTLGELRNRKLKKIDTFSKGTLEGFVFIHFRDFVFSLVFQVPLDIMSLNFTDLVCSGFQACILRQYLA